MKINLLLLSLFFSCNLIFSQSISVESINRFETGELLEYRLHYGIFNTSYASLQLSNVILDNKPVYHAAGYGKTTGLARLFFKVEDYYDSYFDASSINPLFFKRNIDEGGYTKNLEIVFDQEKNIAYINNIKEKKKTEVKTAPNSQDLISSLYYLRKFFKKEDIKENEYFNINMFYDSKNRFFELQYLGTEVIRTRFGKIECLKFKPTTKRSRIFRGEGSITIWLSNDQNRIPVRIQADLLIGSIKADLNNFDGLIKPLVAKTN